MIGDEGEGESRELRNSGTPGIGRVEEVELKILQK